jgi:hypothetical protein
MFPHQENQKDNPKAILGTFDPSARPFIQDDLLTFALPIKRLAEIIGYMEESFVTTPSWGLIQRRIKKEE